MAYRSVASRAYDCGNPSRKGLTRSIIGGAALAFVAMACAWSVYANFIGTGVDPVVTAEPAAPAASEEGAASMAPATPTVSAAPTPPPVDPDTYALLFDATSSAGSPTGALTGGAPRHLGDLLTVSASLQAAIAVTQEVAPSPPVARRLAQIIPLPPPRPLELTPPPSQNAALHRRAQANKVVATTTEDKRSIFEKLFGIPQRSEQTLAYAAPDGGVSNDGQSTTPGGSGLYDRQTAVYDISAHTVYMPDGTKLEAHSGLGSRLDDPSSVHEKMRGPTPPHVYELEPRVGLFHGVRALRLIPVGGSNPFGRTGLLAHSYMLGPNGDSNGCVSFRNYDAFLRAYMNREVKRLVVVPRA